MKIEAYKDSKGKLHEKEEDYLLAELEIESESIVSLHERWLAFMEKDPTFHYQLLKHLINLAKEDNLAEEKIDRRIEMLEKAKEIKRKNTIKNKDSYSANPNWNDSPGEWRGISAQDLGIPNC